MFDSRSDRAADSLDAFASELTPIRNPHIAPAAAPDRMLFVEPVPQAPAKPRTRTLVFLGILAFIASALLGGSALRLWDRHSGVTALVTIESDPNGAAVLSDGVLRGQTPLRMTLAPGAYAFDVVYEGRHQMVRVDARSDLASVHYVLFDHPSGPIAAHREDR